MAEIVYNEVHMKEIVKKYKNCTTSVETIIASLHSARDIVSNNYEGQGKDIVLDSFDKLTEHLEYFKACCENTAEYVSSALQMMKDKDQAMISLSAEASI